MSTDGVGGERNEENPMPPLAEPSEQKAQTPQPSQPPETRRAKISRVWKDLLHPFLKTPLGISLTIWLLSALFLTLMPYLVVQLLQRHDAALARTERRFTLAVELYERMATFPEPGAREDLDQQKMRIGVLFSDNEGRSRPEFKGVSTFSLYTEWCRIAGEDCLISPPGLRNDVLNISSLPTTEFAPPMPPHFVAKLVEELNFALESVQSDVASARRTDFYDQELVVGANGLELRLPKPRPPSYRIGSIELARAGAFEFDAGTVISLQGCVPVLVQISAGDGGP